MRIESQLLLVSVSFFDFFSCPYLFMVPQCAALAPGRLLAACVAPRRRAPQGRGAACVAPGRLLLDALAAHAAAEIPCRQSHAPPKHATEAARASNTGVKAR